MSKVRNRAGTSTADTGPDIRRLFQKTAPELESRPSDKMAQTRAAAAGSTPSKKPGKQVPSATPDSARLALQPASPILTPNLQREDGSPRSEASACSGLSEQGADPDWRSFLPNLPTKQDLEDMATKIVSAMRQEVQEVRSRVSSLETRLVTVDDTTTELAQRVLTLESVQSLTQQRLTTLFLQQDDAENRSRRNNVRLKRIPEATMGTDLRSTVISILKQLLDRNPTDSLELDRVHRVQSYRAVTSTTPRDVLCHVHFYTMKEAILSAAWQRGSVEFDGVMIQVMLDLSRHTLRMRRLMRPLLDLLRSVGATYHWGHPFHIIVQQGNNSFALHSPDQLPDLCRFLEVDNIDLPNWLDFPSGPQSLGPMPPRPLRSSRGSFRGRRGPSQRQPQRPAPSSHEP